MNGRIYDPTLGRFLQADPFIQAPKNSQSYNRYAYVINNPLSYTDPSGYNFFKSFVKFDGFLAGAFGGGGIIGGAIQSSINHNIHKWVANSQGLTATAGVVIGAFTGAWCGPCSIGFSALFSSNMASYNGASSSEAFHAGGRTAATAGVFYGIGQVFNNPTAGAWDSTGGATHIAAHAIAGGVISDLQGGNFGHGFFSAGVTKFAGGYLPSGDLSAGQIIGGTIASALIGGTASKISGGKFANGARTAAFQYLFNQVRAAEAKLRRHKKLLGAINDMAKHLEKTNEVQSLILEAKEAGDLVKLNALATSFASVGIGSSAIYAYGKRDANILGTMLSERYADHAFVKQIRLAGIAVIEAHKALYVSPIQAGMISAMPKSFQSWYTNYSRLNSYSN